MRKCSSSFIQCPTYKASVIVMIVYMAFGFTTTNTWTFSHSIKTFYCLKNETWIYALNEVAVYILVQITDIFSFNGENETDFYR
jgi:hypothetical protein